MKKICLSTVISMGLFAFSHAYAAPVCEYFEDIGFIYISGSAGSDYADKTVNIMLKEQGNDTPDDDSLIYIADFKTDSNGDYVYKFKINLEQSAGNYFVHSRIGNGESEKTDLVKGEWLSVNSPEYDRDNNKMSFSGLYKYESDDKNLRIKIKSGKTDEITDWDSDVLYTSEIAINENNLFDFSVNLSENDILPGWYTFRIYDDTTNCEIISEFEIYDINSVLSDINTYIKKKNASELLACITDKTDILGIADWEITEGVKVDDLTADILTLLINNDDNIADISELQLEIQKAYATDLINKLEEEDYDGARDILFESYKDIFGIGQFSYYKEYTNLKENNKEENILDTIIGKDFESFSSILDTLSEKTLITAINNAEFWNQVQDIVLTNEDYFTLEDIPSKVWKNICDNRPFDTISEFEKKCNELKKNSSTSTSKPSSNGGGGGGGGGGMVVVGKPSTPVTEKAPENFEQSVDKENTEPVNKESFIDVPQSHWAYESVEYLYSKQIVSGSGDNKFLPDTMLKREELIKMLVNATGSAPLEGKESFTDVKLGEWYAGYIATAKKQGITLGKDDGSFGVGEPLTREDAAVLCFRALGLDEAENTDELNFDDSDLIADYAKTAVARMVKLGIINGKSDGSFAPKDYCTRAEAAKILYGILEGVLK